MDGLSALASIGRYLFIFKNAQLANVDGLPALVSVGDYLLIKDNAELTDVDGLMSLTSVGGSLSSGDGFIVEDNPLLERCAVGFGPIFTVNESDPDVIGDGFDETNTFQNNGAALPGGTADSNCNSVASILAAYMALDADEPAPSADAALALAAYPNPATDAATLRFAVAEAGEATLVVYDALGREVARLVDGVVAGTVETSVDTGALPAGLYVARLTTATGTETVRLTVVR